MAKRKKKSGINIKKLEAVSYKLLQALDDLNEVKAGFEIDNLELAQDEIERARDKIDNVVEEER